MKAARRPTGDDQAHLHLNALSLDASNGICDALETALGKPKTLRAVVSP